MIKNIKDWIWFHIYLGGNEFSPKLDITSIKLMKGRLSTPDKIQKIWTMRERAHKLDMKYKNKGKDNVEN